MAVVIAAMTNADVAANRVSFMFLSLSSCPSLDTEQRKAMGTTSVKSEPKMNERGRIEQRSIASTRKGQNDFQRPIGS
jgi:hypothetical protein